MKPRAPSKLTGFNLRLFSLPEGRGDRRPTIETGGPPRKHYCSRCGAANLAHGVPIGDTMERDYCACCGQIYYRNPRVIVGCLGHGPGGVLLVQRAEGPRRGSWTIPGGYLEEGESTEEGARRELHEEAGVRVGTVKLLGLFEMPQIAQLYWIYTGELTHRHPSLSAESSSVASFGADAIPWENLAFPTDRLTVEHLVNSAGDCTPLCGRLQWDASGNISFSERPWAQTEPPPQSHPGTTP